MFLLSPKISLENDELLDSPHELCEDTSDGDCNESLIIIPINETATNVVTRGQSAAKPKSTQCYTM